MADFADALNHRRSSRPSGGVKVGVPKVGKGALRAFAVLLALAVVVGIVLYFINDVNLLSQDDTQQVAVPHDTTATVAPQDTTAQDTAPTVSPGDYTGELEFLATLVPQMYKDLDKIYAPYQTGATDADRRELRAKVVRYYRGLRGTLGKKSQAQFEAFDKAFADYNKIKTDALG